LLKLVPPFVEMDRPPVVAAYIVLPLANTPLTLLLPRPFPGEAPDVRLVKVVPPFVEMDRPPLVAA
jgi:hypothetical protein